MVQRIPNTAGCIPLCKFKPDDGKNNGMNEVRSILIILTDAYKNEGEENQ